MKLKYILTNVLEPILFFVVMAYIIIENAVEWFFFGSD